MGGLRNKETTNQVSQIPLLGDLPLIGALFRNTQEIVKKSELLVFLSPHIYKNEPPSEEQMVKFDELRNAPMLSLPKKKDKNNPSKTKSK